MIIANRSIERGARAGRRVPGFAIGLDDIGAHLPEADIVIASTASPTPIISRAMVERGAGGAPPPPDVHGRHRRAARHRARVAELEDVYLFTIDDLQSVVNDNLEGRREAARDSGRADRRGSRAVRAALRTRDAAPTIRQLRDDAERARRQTLEQAQRMLANGRIRAGSHRVPGHHADQPADARAEPAPARSGGIGRCLASSRRSSRSTAR